MEEPGGRALPAVLRRVVSSLGGCGDPLLWSLRDRQRGVHRRRQGGGPSDLVILCM